MDVTSNKFLEYLGMGTNVAEIDVSQNTLLKTLDVSGSKLTKLDVSKNTRLEELNCELTDYLTSLDLTKNTKLKSLKSWHSTALTKIKFSKTDDYSQLSEIYCTHCDLDTIEFGTLSGLTLLMCGGNQLTELDLSGSMKLEEVGCSNNPDLTTIYLPKGLTIYISKSDYTSVVYK